MLVILRILFGAGLVYGILKMADNAHTNLEAGDLMNAYYVALCVILGLLNAVVWAPYLGDKISLPITAMITKGTYVERKNRLLQLIRWLEKHHHRRLTVFFCFLEGIHRPWIPTAFVIGLKNAKSGSWWEKVYAREVFKFDNAQNCLIACQTLARRGIDPGIHHNPEVNLLLTSHNRAVKPDPEKLVVPPSPPLPLPARNPKIRLFDEADEMVRNQE